MINILTLLMVLTLAVVSSAYSGCGMCVSTGDCSQAFHSSRGQSCGYVSARPCCCPLNTVCNTRFGECSCHVPSGGTRNHHYSTYNQSPSNNHESPSNNHESNQNHPSDEDDKPLSFKTTILFLLFLCSAVLCPQSNSNGEYASIEDGGGGYDISGDTGGGFDFAGDS